MRRLLIFVIFVALSFGIIYAQSSPFGELTGDSRLYTTSTGLTLENYLEAKENLDSLTSLSERAYGTRKEELGEQIFTRSKDVLISKLGATGSFLLQITADVTETERLNEEVVTNLNTSLESFETKTTELETLVEEAADTDGLNEVSGQINTEIVAALLDFQIAKNTLTIARGEYVIDELAKLAPTILVHIDASAALGGDVKQIEENYDEMMLKLEEVKNTYTQPLDTTALKSANNTLSEAFELAKEILSDLRVLYSRSPWEIDLETQETPEDVEVESSQEAVE